MQEEGVEVGFIHRQPLCGDGNLPPGPVDRWADSAASLRDCVRRQRPDWLWIQLSGYGYSRWGAAFGLARALRALRRALPELAVTVYAHETHCQPSQLGRKGIWLSPWQRYTAGAMVRQADLVFTSMAKYVRQVIHDYGVRPERVVRLPLGPNVPQICFTASERARLRQTLD